MRSFLRAAFWRVSSTLVVCVVLLEVGLRLADSSTGGDGGGSAISADSGSTTSPTCAAGLSPCNGVCVDTTLDPSHCGSCSNGCPASQSCSGGTCSAPTGIIPHDRLTAWVPGMMARGGIPTRTTVCATVQASTYGNGARDASAGIQAALDGCPAGQVVQLSAGTFTIDNSYLGVTKGITLRGAGPGKTILQKTNGAKPGTHTAADAQPIVIIGPNRWPWPDSTTSQNLTADGAKGAHSVTVANGSGFAAGQFVLLDELTGWAWLKLPPTSAGPNAHQIRGGDRAVWNIHNPPVQNVDDPSSALSWFCRADRPITEVKEVASVSGNTVTFTTPLHIGYRRSHAAQLTRYTGSNAHVTNAGVEDLTVTGGSDGNIRFETAAYSWAKKVEDTAWLGQGVSIDNSFRIEVRDSYIHDAAWPEPGGGGYAIALADGASEVLVENNIIMKANKMMVVAAAGAGSVVGYNYADDGLILTDPSWQEVGLNGSHMVGSHHVLFEGNESFNYDSDFTHGNAIYMTVLRNHLTGVRRDYPGMGNARTAGLMFGSWWHSFLGNVLGFPGMTGWQYEDPGMTMPNAPGDKSYSWGSGNYVWKLGYDPEEWFSPTVQYADPQVLRTTIRHGNFDYVTNSVHWDPSNANHNIPASLYLKHKPAFFDAGKGYVWPWVDPTAQAPVRTLPAKARYDAGTPFTQP